MSDRQWATDSLVNGLQIRMTAEELAGHMNARADYHEKRRNEKRDILPQVEEAAEKIKAQQPAALVSQFSKSGVSNRNSYAFDGDDAVENLKNDIETHHNKSIAFRFLATHLFDADYCLSRDDLVRLEILKN